MKWLEEYKRFVSRDGKVFRYSRDGKRIVECKPTYGRYITFCVRLNGKRTMAKLHRMVALAFIPNPENKPYVDHIDRNTYNNNVENLRWVTPHENNMNCCSHLEGQSFKLFGKSRRDLNQEEAKEYRELVVAKNNGYESMREYHRSRREAS